MSHIYSVAVLQIFFLLQSWSLQYPTKAIWTVSWWLLKLGFPAAEGQNFTLYMPNLVNYLNYSKYFKHKEWSVKAFIRHFLCLLSRPCFESRILWCWNCTSSCSVILLLSATFLPRAGKQERQKWSLTHSVSPCDFYKLLELPDFLNTALPIV